MNNLISAVYKWSVQSIDDLNFTKIPEANNKNDAAKMLKGDCKIRTGIERIAGT